MTVLLAALRYRLMELTVLALLAMFAVRVHPGLWVAVAFVAFTVGRQEWRTWRLPAEPAMVPEDTDIPTERAEERA